jgi:hypothetical protein
MRGLEGGRACGPEGASRAGGGRRGRGCRDGGAVQAGDLGEVAAARRLCRRALD